MGHRLCVPSHFIWETTKPRRRATTLGGTTRPTIHLSKLVEPEILDSTWPWLDIGEPSLSLPPCLPPEIRKPNLPTPIPLGITVLLRPSTETSIWTSLPSPQSSTPTIALGTSHGINILTETLSNWVEGRTLTTSSDVFALEWMSSNGVLAAGCRNGSVRIYDQRERKTIGMELRHGSAVTAVRKVDDWRVVVCGLESRVCFSLTHSTPSCLSRYPWVRDTGGDDQLTVSLA